MKRARRKLPGTVQKIVKPFHDGATEKAEISIHDADHLYREIRIENKLEDDQGKQVRLKEGAQVEVSIEADKDAIVDKK